MHSIEIICPLYNAEEHVHKLHESLLKQKGVNIEKISYILTESYDNTKGYLLKNNIHFDLISKEEFSHSLTREKKAMDTKAEIIVFITQDIVIEDEFWLCKLTEDIASKKCAAAFSRQISKYNNIEKYTREKNYPSKSRIVSKEDIENLGLNTFFFSDASSAIDAQIFKKLNGYDNKNLSINEDMYIAYKLIINNYKIKYVSESIVYHSHKFTLKQLFDRYKATGNFFSQNKYIDQYGTINAGGNLAKYILKRAIEEKNLNVLLRFIPDMTMRYIGMKVGKNGAK